MLQLITISKMPETLNIQTAIHRIGGPFPDVSLLEVKIESSALTYENARDLGTALSANRTLRNLDLSACSIDDKKLGAILAGVNESLIGINLSKNQITQHGVATLVEKSLKQINLADNNIKDAGVITFAQSSHEQQSLESLDLTRNGVFGIPDKFLIDLLEKNTSLQELILDGNKIQTGTLAKINKILEERSGRPSASVAGSAEAVSSGAVHYASPNS